MKNVTLVSLLLAVFSIAGAINQYKNGFSYRYTYSGHVTTTSVQNVSAGWKLEAVVNFHFVGQSPANVQSVIMTLESPKFQDYQGNSLIDSDSSKWREPILLERNADGRIGKLFSKPGHPTDILNMKRGIASLLQVAKANLQKGKTSFSNEEKDVVGSCSFSYVIHRGSADAQRTGMRYLVSKRNNFTKCTGRPVMAYSTLEVTDCDDCGKVDAHVPNSFTETNCSVYNVAANPFIETCRSVDKYTVNIDNNIVVIDVRRFMKFQSKKDTYKVYPLLHEICEDRKGLMFEQEKQRHHNSNPRDQKQSFMKVKQALQELSQKAPMISSNPDAISHDAPEHFLKLVETLRWEVDNKTFDFIYRHFYNQKQFIFWLRGALPFISNHLATKIIQKKILSQELTGYDVIQVLSRLAVTPRPNEKMCDHVMNICSLPSVTKDRNIYSTCWLAFGSLLHNVYRDQLNFPRRFLQKIARQYQKYDGGKDSERFVVTLKTIGNAGMKDFFTRILKILNKRDKTGSPYPNIVIVSAIDALRRMRLTTKEKKQMKDSLKQIFADVRSCPELRTNAFTMLMRVRPSISQLAALSDVIVKEKIQHVKNYVMTYLVSTIESKQPCPAHEIRQARLLMNFVVKRGQKDYKPSFLHAMQYKLEKNSSVTGFPEECEFRKGYTHSSFIPRYLKIKYSKQLMGYKFIVHEFHLRQEGLLPFVKHFIGPQDHEKSGKSWWNVLRLKRNDGFDPVTEKLRKINKKLNMTVYREEELRLSLSSKLFGSEIEYLVYDKQDKMFQAFMKGENIQIDKNWLQNALTLGIKYDKRAMDLLFDGMRIIPTSIGLPLSLKLVIGGVLNHRASIQLTTKPLLSLLSWKNKPTEIKGDISVRPRAAVGSTGQIIMTFRDSKFGLKHQANISILVHLKGTIDYNLPQQTYVHTLEVPDKRRTFFSSGSAAQVYTATKGRPPKVNYIPFPLQHIGERSKPRNPTPPIARTSRVWGPFSLGGSLPEELPRRSELRVEPTETSGYGFRLEVQNITSDRTEKVFRIKCSRLGTSPLDQYIGELRIKNEFLSTTSSNIPVHPQLSHDVVNLTITHPSTNWKLCLGQSLNIATKSSALTASWGRRCNDYNANFTIAFSAQEKSCSLESSLWWDETPPYFRNFHYKICSLEYMIPMTGRGQLPSYNLPGRNQSTNLRYDAKRPHPGNKGLPPGWPRVGKSSVKHQDPSKSTNHFHPLLALIRECPKHINIKITVTRHVLDITSSFTKGKVMYSIPLPENIQSGLINYKNTKLMLEKLMLPSFPRCKIQLSSDAFTTFDKRSFVYNMRTGCSHVLAKDLSSNNLFTVLMKRTQTNQHAIILYLKGKNNKYDTFKIQSNGKVQHIKTPLKLKHIPGTDEMRQEHPGYWSLVKRNNVTKLQSQLGVEVIVNTDGVVVTLSSWYYSIVGGLCGHYNNEPRDDFRSPRDFEEITVKTFAMSWMIPSKSCKSRISSECSSISTPLDIKVASSKTKCLGSKPFP